MEQKEKKAAKTVMTIEEYLRKLKSNKNIYTERTEKEKALYLCSFL